MKIKQNIILLTATAVLFALTSSLTVHALEDDLDRDETIKSWTQDLRKKWDKQFKKNWNAPQKRESSFLSFQNNTPYDVAIYASIRPKGQKKYGSPIELGSVPAGATTNIFPGLKDGFIGRKGTKYWIKVIGNEEGTPAIDAAPVENKKLEFKDTSEPYPVLLKFKKVGAPSRDNVEMLLKVTQRKGIDMVLSPVDSK